MPSLLRIGCAGWALPAPVRERFGPGASNLARYAATLNAVEINSSFYRPHRRATWERWSDSVADDFRFSVKLPKAITHERRLANADLLLPEFFEQIGGLGAKLGCLLAQLPPSLAFDAATAEMFFAQLHAQCPCPVVLEARHTSWMLDEARALLDETDVALVFADPDPLGQLSPDMGGEIAYVRLHGAPVMYRSSYTPEYLAVLAERLAEMAAQGKPTWCVFDNTASGAAAANALDLAGLLRT